MKFTNLQKTGVRTPVPQTLRSIPNLKKTLQNFAFYGSKKFPSDWSESNMKKPFSDVSKIEKKNCDNCHIKNVYILFVKCIFEFLLMLGREEDSHLELKHVAEFE